MPTKYAPAGLGTERHSLRLPPELDAWLREASYKNRESVNSLMIQALEAWKEAKENEQS